MPRPWRGHWCGAAVGTGLAGLCTRLGSSSCGDWRVFGCLEVTEELQERRWLGKDSNGCIGVRGALGGLSCWGDTPGSCPRTPRRTPWWADPASAAPAAPGRRCRPGGCGQSSASPSPVAAQTLWAGSVGAVGVWGRDPPPAPASGTLGLLGSTCTKRYRCDREPAVSAGNAGQNQRSAKGMARCHLPRVLLSGGKKRHISSYLRVLPRPGRALLLCLQSRGVLAALRVLPGSRLHLGTHNGVRQGHTRGPGRRAGGQDGWGAKTQRKPRGFAAPEKSQEHVHAW